ncbi:TPA: ogr/Delta-like zinc finger family protein [Escherichia coli]|nr:ogr/Delta-like zinc finger family protein [Escherichia coli]
MAFPCPTCGANSRTRTSRMENNERTIRKTWYQCNNIECGCCFHTYESVEGLTPQRSRKLNDFPWQDLPASHQAKRQGCLPLLDDTPGAGRMPARIRRT